MITVRTAQTATDIQTAAILFREYADTLDFDLDFQDFVAELANLPGDYSSPDGCLLLAFAPEQPAGCVALRKFAPDICEMKRLYVRPAYRGLNLGRRLAETIIREARFRGYRKMVLDTVPTMQAAIGLYESLGFVPIAPYRYNPIAGAKFYELELQKKD